MHCSKPGVHQNFTPCLPLHPVGVLYMSACGESVSCATGKQVQWCLQVDPPLDMFGIAKRANARWTTDAVQPATVALWVLDTAEELHAACMEGADVVITNQPLKLLAADI